MDQAIQKAYVIPIHTLRVEGDDQIKKDINCAFLFQSTPSVWRVTMLCAEELLTIVFQSTPSVWRVTSAVYWQGSVI